MSRTPKHRVVAALIDRHGRTYANEAGITLRNTPSPLFRLLVLSLLLSARIDANIAVAAARALAEAGWTTPEKLADSRWEERARVLNRSGYARYDERTSTMLADMSDLVLRRYDGDLRKLRDAAGHDPAEERRALQDFSGIGAVGAAIFAREVQLVWDEMYPFADDRALGCAERLGLGAEVKDLQRNTSDQEHFTLLVAALVRCDLAGDHAAILEAAKS